MFRSLLARAFGAYIVGIFGPLVSFSFADGAPAQPTHVSLSTSPGGADYALATLVVAGLLIFILRPRKKQVVTADVARKK